MAQVATGPAPQGGDSASGGGVPVSNRELIARLVEQRGCVTVKEVARELNISYSTAFYTLKRMPVAVHDFGKLVLFCSPQIGERAIFHALKRIGVPPDKFINELCTKLATVRSRTVQSIKPSRLVRDITGRPVRNNRTVVLAHAFVKLLGDAVAVSRDGFGRWRYVVDVEKALDRLQCGAKRATRLTVRVPARLVAEAEKAAAGSGQRLPDAVHAVVARLYALLKDGDYGGATQVNIYVHQETKAMIDQLVQKGIFRDRSEAVRLALALVARRVSL
ncbi:hypothetical protein [Pyrobaculum sp.]|uniref:ribbon-helix-helix domain-containing protein n=1 Tax=Pyrobaculum sp. TaxID=2004705 RepID=UPI003D10B8B9